MEFLVNAASTKLSNVHYPEAEPIQFLISITIYNGNLDISIGKSARLVIWRSEVRIPAQVQNISLLKSKIQYICVYVFNGNLAKD